VAASQCRAAGWKVAVIDHAVLLKRCMGNTSFVLALLDELEATGRRRIDEVTAAFRQGDLHATGTTAHALKGAAGVLGAGRLKDLATAIERVAASGATQRLETLVAQLDHEMDRCLEVIPLVREQISYAAP
jgi:HPt (histidine-containing phosphotransfer) domain-containing protein